MTDILDNEMREMITERLKQNYYYFSYQVGGKQKTTGLLQKLKGVVILFLYF